MSNGVLRCTNGRRVDTPEMLALIERAARTALSEAELLALRSAPASQADAALNARVARLQAAMAPEAEPLVLRTLAAAEATISRAAAAAPEPDAALRAERTAELQRRLRIAPRDICRSGG